MNKYLVPLLTLLASTASLIAVIAMDSWEDSARRPTSSSISTAKPISLNPPALREKICPDNSYYVQINQESFCHPFPNPNTTDAR